MKNLKVLLALLLVGLFAGCSKETLLSDDENLDGKVRVAFTVDGFEHELAPFPNPIIASAEKGRFSATEGSGSTDIRDHINVLEIYVYYGSHPSSFELVDQVKQFAGDDDFGTYERYFDTEVYTRNIHLVFHGAKLNEGTQTDWNSINQFSSLGIGFEPTVSDAFIAYKQSVDLDKPEEIESSIKLSRYVGRIDLNIQEAFPESAGYIDVAVENTARYFSPFLEEGFTEARGDDLPYQTVKRIQILPEHIADSALQEQIYFIPREKKGSEPSPVTIKVAAYSDTDELIREVSIPDVLIQANKVTKLSGTIFTIPNLTQEIGIDTEWDGEFPEREF